MQFPRASSDRLMLAPSRNLSPRFVVAVARSEPARSIRESLAMRKSVDRFAVLSRCLTNTCGRTPSVKVNAWRHYHAKCLTILSGPCVYRFIAVEHVNQCSVQDELALNLHHTQIYSGMMCAEWEEVQIEEVLQKTVIKGKPHKQYRNGRTIERNYWKDMAEELAVATKYDIFHCVKIVYKQVMYRSHLYLNAKTQEHVCTAF